ncbi:hypothetical protein J8273_6987 [Carpediemonas membranifera]|uniref:Uncharacterized protein n=1 Tax=Carpediemonas membranifera TaxID=201153 RepID=A0A8J6B160_9EUKA|nr:hypothetical protein J8273_6987 [Carpediemonas membranifera]|eukprot:KAG9390734.1 hypothetical protein J8273_6987 [Carpediemonas membranifera]
MSTSLTTTSPAAELPPKRPKRQRTPKSAQTDVTELLEDLVLESDVIDTDDDGTYTPKTQSARTRNRNKLRGRTKGRRSSSAGLSTKTSPITGILRNKGRRSSLSLTKQPNAPVFPSTQSIQFGALNDENAGVAALHHIPSSLAEDLMADDAHASAFSLPDVGRLGSLPETDGCPFLPALALTESNGSLGWDCIDDPLFDSELSTMSPESQCDISFAVQQSGLEVDLGPKRGISMSSIELEMIRK